SHALYTLSLHDALPILSCGGSAGRTAFRLWHRPIWPQEIILHHGCGLSHRHSAIRFLVEFLELRVVSRADRRRDRRRVRRDQFRSEEHTSELQSLAYLV